MIRVTMICSSAVLPEDISNLLEVLIVSLKCSEAWMTTYCHAVQNEVANPPAPRALPWPVFPDLIRAPTPFVPTRRHKQGCAHTDTSGPTVMPAHQLRPGLPVQSLTLGSHSRYFLELTFPSFPLFTF